MTFEAPKNKIERKPEVLYHASSSQDIETLEVRGERTRDPDEKPSVFATPNKALASIFLVPTDDSWTHSGLVNDIPFIVISDKDRFIELDNGGSIYSVNSDTFETNPEKGLRENEWTSSEAVAIQKNEKVDSALNTMLRLGVQVYFVDTETFKNFNSADDHGETILRSLIPEKHPDFD